MAHSPWRSPWPSWFDAGCSMSKKHVLARSTVMSLMDFSRFLARNHRAMDTHERTLAINLDKTTFGTFAEIGAGQEVARWFLQAGGAAGTVAKTISAYDMTFSDAIYGKSGRYVSRERLVAMLDHEYALLLERLEATRGAETRVFLFAD